LRQLYVGSKLEAGATAEVTGEDYHHLTRSLRAKVGEPVRLVDADFRAFKGVVVAIDRRAATFSAELELPSEAPLGPLALGLCGPAAEAFDAALDAAVQLGVTEFVPLQSARSRAMDASKLPRWERIARESCCQSLRSRPPELSPPQTLENFLKAARPGKKWLAWQGAEAPPRQMPHSEPLTLVVGPEGGFEDPEIAMARAAGWQFLSLGPQILRVPVAVASGLAVLQQLRTGA
jgi:16S rRNA (uracil1498-N3)-methyltransferase